MRIRPWPLVLLAVLQILTPVGTILFNAWALGVKPIYVLRWLMERPSLEIFETLFLMPIAGIAIYQMKAWSYVIFLIAMAWSLATNIQHWQYATEAFPIWKGLIVYALQIVLAVYFMIPSVRKTYLDRSVRWWEAKRRFSLRIPVQLGVGTPDATGMMQNISEGGVLVQAATTLETGKEVLIRFEVLGEKFELSGQIKYVVPQAHGDHAYGIQFRHTHETLKRMKNLVRGLELIGISDRDLAFKKPWYQGIREWAVTLLSTGKGLVPEIKSNRKT